MWRYCRLGILGCKRRLPLASPRGSSCSAELVHRTAVKGRRPWAGPWPRRCGTRTSCARATARSQRPARTSCYIDLHLVHEVTSPQAFDGLRVAGRPRATPGPHDRDRGPQHPHARRSTSRSPTSTSRTQIETLRTQRRRVRRPPALARRRRAGHRARGRAAARPHAARHHGRLRRLAHLARTAPSARWPSASARREVEHVLATQTLPLQAVQDHGRSTSRAPCRPGVTREGHHPRRHRQDRHGRRPGLRPRVPRQRHPRAVDGRPHDHLQHVDRGRRTRRHGRARRDHLRLHRRASPHAPKGADWDAAVAYWKTLATDADATFDAEV